MVLMLGLYEFSSVDVNGVFNELFDFVEGRWLVMSCFYSSCLCS